MRGMLRVKAIGFGPGTVAAWHFGRDRELGFGHFTLGKGGISWVLGVLIFLVNMARSGIAIVLDWPQDLYGPQGDHCCNI